MAIFVVVDMGESSVPPFRLNLSPGTTLRMPLHSTEDSIADAVSASIARSFLRPLEIFPTVAARGWGRPFLMRSWFLRGSLIDWVWGAAGGLIFNTRKSG